MDVYFTAPYAPFVAALGAVLVLVILELTALAITGAGLSDVSELLFDTGALSTVAVFNWLLVRGLPLSVALILFLSLFGLTGMGMQGVLPTPLPTALVVAGAAVIAFLGLKGFGSLLRPLFATTTTAVSEASLVGRTAELTTPRASRGFAGEARVIDEHGYSHLVMVEPVNEAQTLVAGRRLILVERIGPARFAARPD